jgi:antitoxin VapB
MTLSIRDPETDRLARELAARTGRPITSVVRDALVAYAATAAPSTYEARQAALDDLLAEFDRQPVLDGRSSKELLDELYDEDGLPA